MKLIDDRDDLFGIGLAFVAGFVDAAAFIALGGLFTAHVTGNFVLLGAEFISASTGTVAKLLALPVFIAAVAATRGIQLALTRWNLDSVRPLIGLEALVLACFAGFGLTFGPFGSPDSPSAVGVGMLGVAAMGMQNAIGRSALGHLAATTVMTVNVTQTVLDAVELMRRKPDQVDVARRRFRRLFPGVLAFAAGAFVGAIGIAMVSLWCIALPVAILAVLVMVGRAT